jgi:hypothetical protein
MASFNHDGPKISCLVDQSDVTTQSIADLEVELGSYCHKYNELLNKRT